jgi:hypothetical protein
VSCAEGPQKEICKLVAAFFNEAFEFLRTEAEQDHQDMPEVFSLRNPVLAIHSIDAGGGHPKAQEMRRGQATDELRRCRPNLADRLPRERV